MQDEAATSMNDLGTADTESTNLTQARSLPVLSWSEQEMLDGFMDGLDLDCPEPSGNRSNSYRHGFANARDDLAGKPRATAEALRRMADVAIAADMQ